MEKSNSFANFSGNIRRHLSERTRHGVTKVMSLGGGSRNLLRTKEKSAGGHRSKVDGGTAENHVSPGKGNTTDDLTSEASEFSGNSNVDDQSTVFTSASATGADIHRSSTPPQKKKWKRSIRVVGGVQNGHVYLRVDEEVDELQVEQETDPSASERNLSTYGTNNRGSLDGIHADLARAANNSGVLAARISGLTGDGGRTPGGPLEDGRPLHDLVNP
eukprot:GSA120T00005190001.1